MPDDPMNIAAAVNPAYIMPLKVMLFSLARNTKRTLSVYLLYRSLNETERNSIKDFVKEKCCGTLHEIFVDVDDRSFSKYLSSRPQWSAEIFYRLLLPYILDTSIEKILWLDADIIVCGSIDSLYDTDMGQNYLCAAPDDGGEQSAKRLGLPPGQRYFNSGLLLMNLPAIRRDFSQRRILSFFSENQETLPYGDQDTLNCLMGHNVLLVDESIYNNQAHLRWRVSKNARVIHFIMSIKPWKVYYCGDKYAVSRFWEYAEQCGFRRGIFSSVGNALARIPAAVYLKFRQTKQKGGGTK